MRTKEKRMEAIAVSGVRLFCISIFLVYSFMMVEMLFFSYKKSGHLTVEDAGYYVPWYAVHEAARLKSAKVSIGGHDYHLIARSDHLYGLDEVTFVAGSTTNQIYTLASDGYDYRFFNLAKILMLLVSGLMFFRLMSELGFLVILSFLLSFRLLDFLLY